MVNPRAFAKFVFKKYKGTVIDDIWPELLFFTAVAVVVCAVNEFTKINFFISNQMLTVLGTVLGLVVSFRTSSAYDRYWEGRKLWSTIALVSRSLAQIIWLHIPIERKPPAGAPPTSEEISRLKAVIEKRTMLNLIQAYSVSLKHLLRGEPGIYYEDLYPLINFLPRYASSPSMSPVAPETTVGAATGEKVAGTHDQGTLHVNDKNETLPLWWTSPDTKLPPVRKQKKKPRRFDPESALPQVEAEIPLRPARNAPKDGFFDYLPIFIPLRWVAKAFSRRDDGDERTLGGKRKPPSKVEGNVPLEICLFLSAYLAYALKNGLLTPAMATAFANQLQAMQDCLENLQRIRNTPIPFAYQAHLRMSLWLYLLFLPFEVYSAFKWLTVPATTFASFLILGFLEIGQEIENPFCYDENDLDLDSFCLAIQRELHEITTHAALDPAEFLFSSNQPFAPADRRTAAELLSRHDVEYVKPGADGTDSLRRTFVANWKEVNTVTRQASWKYRY